MTELEMDQLCEQNPDCEGKCLQCPLYAEYKAELLGHQEDNEEEQDDETEN